MTPRDWLGMVSLMLGFVGGMAGLIKWLVAGWMRSMEESDRQISEEVERMSIELREYERIRHGCQSRHDRELADVREEMRSHYIRRDELDKLVDKLTARLDLLKDKFDDRMDVMGEKIDQLKERVMERGGE